MNQCAGLALESSECPGASSAYGPAPALVWQMILPVAVTGETAGAS